MQLIKKDIYTTFEIGCHPNVDKNEAYLKYYRFQQVMEFYKEYKNIDLFNVEKYRTNPKYPKTEELWELYTSSEHSIMAFRDWLFDYCFTEGIK